MSYMCLAQNNYFFKFSKYVFHSLCLCSTGGGINLQKAAEYANTSSIKPERTTILRQDVQMHKRNIQQTVSPRRGNFSQSLAFFFGDLTFLLL